MSFDSSTLSLFVDGKVAGSVVHDSFVPQLFALPWVLAGDGVGVDEVAFYTHDLSASRVKAHFDAGRGVAEPRQVTTKFAYDGLGNRVTKTTGDRVHRYTWDPTFSVPKLVEDATVGGDTTSVVYGQGIEWDCRAGRGHLSWLTGRSVAGFFTEP